MTRTATWRLVAVILVVATAGCGSAEPGAKSEVERQRDRLTSISVSPLGDAKPLRLGTPTDLPIVVNVWATWCVPCRTELPAFDEVASRYEGDVRFVGINLGDDDSDATEFIDEVGVTFDQYLDPESTAQTALSITTMPATVLVRADGTIAATHNGALDAAELESLLEEKLGISATTTGGS